MRFRTTTIVLKSLYSVILITIVITFSFTYFDVYSTNNRTKDPNTIETEKKEETKEKDEVTEQQIEISGPNIHAEAAFLINPSTGVIIYENHCFNRFMCILHQFI